MVSKNYIALVADSLLISFPLEDVSKVIVSDYEYMKIIMWAVDKNMNVKVIFAVINKTWAEVNCVK